MDRLIGIGGMGEVYLAEDSTLRRKVALKLLPERFIEDEDRVRRFQREARAASALNHPNIITIYEVGQADSRHYIATEYIDGRTLRDRITSRQPMSIAEMLDISLGVTNALCAAHEAGILHRDIKPENIMLRPDGYVKVLDFGLAKLQEGGFLRNSTTGAVMGTLLYISPEQARGFHPDERSDIYSLGVVMYEMLTRRPPIATDSFVELAMAIATKEPERPSSITPGVPAELDRIVLKTLAKDPDDRYHTARELLADLRALRQELEFQNKLSSVMLNPTRLGSTPDLANQPTALLTRPPQSTSTIFHLFGQRVRRAPATVALMVILSLAIVLYAVVRNNFLGERPIDSVAVLPFTNASGDPNSEYLSDGIAESIIDSLSQLPSLQVVARSTTFRYKGKNVDPLVIGQELKVRGVVTGQLLQRGDTIIIRARLTDVRKGTQVWGQQYDRKLADVLPLQQDIAQEIFDELRIKLSGEERKLLTRRTADSSEAFQLYLKGRYFRNKYNEDAIRKAIGFFNQAIDIDPTYALAYAGLADAYYGLSNLYMAPKEAMPRVREASRRALDLDDSVAQAHTTLALGLAWFDWDFRGGEREFRRALELNPNDAEARRQYALFLTATAQFEAAIAEARKATEIDPLSVPASWDLARTLFFAGRYVEAEEQTRRTIELDPHFANAYMTQSQIALAQGRTADALALIDKAVELGGRTPLLLSMWGYEQARAGNRDAATRVIEELKSRPSYTLPLFLARLHAARGENDEAIYWLQQLADDKSESLVWLKVDPTLATLREDPRFEALAKKVGL
ncbi:MAG: protein kinase [Acidobacteria bacterium]|nr:protein kinase [Acidobacteriota bacterium]